MLFSIYIFFTFIYLLLFSIQGHFHTIPYTHRLCMHFAALLFNYNFATASKINGSTPCLTSVVPSFQLKCWHFHADQLISCRVFVLRSSVAKSFVCIRQRPRVNAVAFSCKSNTTKLWTWQDKRHSERESGLIFTLHPECVWSSGCEEEHWTVIKIRSWPALSACPQIWIINDFKLPCVNSQVSKHDARISSTPAGSLQVLINIFSINGVLPQNDNFYESAL